MFFKWLKFYMPRSLYGRAALILLVPIVTIQLVVSVVFIQRLYEDVTRQMTRNMAIDLNYVLDQVDREKDLNSATKRIARLQDALQIELVLPAKTKGVEERQFADISGKVIIETLRNQVVGINTVDLYSKRKFIQIWLQTRHGNMEIIFPRSRVTARNPHQLLVLMLVTGILMAFISIIFLRNQLRPIKRLAAASEAFGKGQTVPYQPRGANEVRAAGAAFLAMRGRIERQIEQRTMMLSGVSHDMRTPLTRLKLGLSMMDESADVKDLQSDVDDMQSLLDGFLDFASGDCGEQPEDTDVVELVTLAVSNAHRAGKDVTLMPGAGSCHLIMRKKTILRAVENLIGNAVRYGTRAEVSVTQNERSIVISVADDGPGIAEKDRQEALKPFSRLEPARNQNKGTGVGLGLSIANDAVRTHGGSLRMGKSEKMGGLKVDLVFSR